MCGGGGEGSDGGGGDGGEGGRAQISSRLVSPAKRKLRPLELPRGVTSMRTWLGLGLGSGLGLG